MRGRRRRRRRKGRKRGRTVSTEHYSEVSVNWRSSSGVRIPKGLPFCLIDGSWSGRSGD